MTTIKSNCGVYRWLNTVNGKSYVGSSKNVNRRKLRHVKELRWGVHRNSKLQRAWNKYGPDIWKFEILETCLENELIQKEQAALDSLDAVQDGYNIRPVAESNLGIRHSDASKAKISLGNKGKLLGKRQAPELVAKRVAAITGQKRSDETKERMRKQAILHNAGAMLGASAKARWNNPIWASAERERRAKRSICEPYRNAIALLLLAGKNMREIWKTLKSEYRFSGGELSVERFIRKINRRSAASAAA